ncbi:MAG: peptidase, M56 family protein, partial [Ruminococcus sp.]|nr:peptidase, M56 family protein [Ruminococcus sp.]
MNEFMKILLSLSVSGALLLLLILGLKPLYKNKFSKRWQYYIWIIVALRFLLPLTPDITIVGSLFEKFNAAEITSEIPTIQNTP